MRVAPRSPPKAKSKPQSSAARVRAHRAKMKKRGLKLVQMWMPDRKSPAYKAEALRQSRNIANAPDREEVERFIASLYHDWE